MIGIGNVGFTGLEATTVFLNNVFFLIFAVIAVTPLGVNIRKTLYHESKSNNVVFMIYQITEMLTPALLLFLSLLSLIGASYNPFLYFRF